MSMSVKDMATDLVHALDASTWAASIGITLDDWQASLVRSEAKELAVVAGRQSGKSMAATVKGVHIAVFEPGALVLMVAPALRQSQLLISESKAILARTDQKLISETTTSLELASGSKIIAVPGSGSTIRGVSNVRLLILDEAAFIDDDVISATLPMGATNPRNQTLMISTPNGMDNHFARAWHSEDGSLGRYEIRAEDCPRISKSFLQRQRLTLPETVYRQEFECSFEDSAGAVFSSDDIAKLHLEQVESWDL